ncbi:MAG: DNA topoisomerase IV subunit A [Bacilli bacterium]|nr:DNA topoisomerase IV subunit A [Bacilli bacterium]
MAKKKVEEKSIIEKIQEYSLEEIMGDGFARYSKEIIQERALPDVRDGLKPVQRRILYAMYLQHYTHDKPYQKSAKAVGFIMGNFHPHGDSSIYEALIRMSQPWKMGATLIDVHGNNGSIDGDGPAAMRYTEARLSKLAEEMLVSIKKNTVEMAYNFDDTELEPTVLPTPFPNLLVNGSTGISAGYATNIPTHNLSEVIDATIKRIDSPNCKLETIMEILPGPDFPTGGVIEGKQGLVEAYTKGKGKVVLKAKTEIVKNGSKQQIIVHSIPYEVIKEQLIKKITEIKLDKKVEGINDVIDESDYEHMARIVIDLKKEANAELILNYLLKNTDLQVNYNFNMVAIVNRRPRLVGILEILDAFIEHEKSVVRRRTEFDLNEAKFRYHILEGLVKAISILDEVIATIRASKNKSDAIQNLVEKYEFSPEQAKAIVELQLYRLTNTDIVATQNEMAELEKNMYIWNQILNNEDALKHVIKNELKIIKKNYGVPRKTEIKDEITEIKIDLKTMIPKERVVVVVTHEGYVKRVPYKSYTSASEEPTMKPGDFITNLFDVTTQDYIIMFTSLGNYLYLPVHKIPEGKWKELGKHVNNIVALSAQESIVASYVYDKEEELILATKLGMIKRLKEEDLEASRISKAMVAMKLKETDELVRVCLAKEFVVTFSQNGYYCKFHKVEVPLVGARGSGVKAMNLKDDAIVAMISYDSLEYLTLFTNQNTSKRMKESELEETGRAKRGNTIMKKVKSVHYEITQVLPTTSRSEITLISEDGKIDLKNSEIPIMDLSSTGSVITKKTINYALEKVGVMTPEEKKEEKKVDEQVSFNLNDFKL